MYSKNQKQSKQVNTGKVDPSGIFFVIFDDATVRSSVKALTAVHCVFDR